VSCLEIWNQRVKAQRQVSYFVPTTRLVLGAISHDGGRVCRLLSYEVLVNFVQRFFPALKAQRLERLMKANQRFPLRRLWEN
jgi:hypothetical protein